MHAAKRPNSTKIKSFKRHFREHLYPRNIPAIYGILGPMLFLIYINDLPLSVIYSNIHLFADDTKCSKSQSEAIHLQSDLDRLTHWSLFWRLLFNEKKCVLMQFSGNPRALVVDSTYQIAGKQITPKENHRDLGLILQQNLDWSNHYDLISGKAYGQHRFVEHFHSQPTKLKLYLTLVRSQLSYCSQIWRPVLMKDINALERIQRRATKFISSQKIFNWATKKDLPSYSAYVSLWTGWHIKSYNNQSCRFNIKNFISFQLILAHLQNVHFATLVCSKSVSSLLF